MSDFPRSFVMPDDPEEDEEDAEEPEAPLTAIPARPSVAVSKTIYQRDLRRERRDLSAEEGRELVAISLSRPRTRADCASVPRPCPYVGCRHNTYLDVTRAGSIVLNWPVEPDAVPAEMSCVLDLADRGGMTLDEVASVFGITRQAAAAMEGKVLRCARESRPELAEFLEPEG